MEDKRMTSREFTDLVGISLKKLEKLEKEGKIIPVREGRIRYYYREQVKQFEQSEGKLILGVDVPRDVIMTLSYNTDIEKSTLLLLEYCLDHNIQIGDTTQIKVTDIKNDIVELVNVCRDPRIAKIIYQGKDSVFPILQEECDANGIILVNAKKEDSDHRKNWLGGIFNGRRQK